MYGGSTDDGDEKDVESKLTKLKNTKKRLELVSMTRFYCMVVRWQQTHFKHALGRNDSS